jgi:hypothetical protein
MTNVITAKQIREWAQQIAYYISKEYTPTGESGIFEHGIDVGNEGGFTATVDYQCFTRSDEGTQWASPSWWIEDERTTIDRVTDTNGKSRPELAEALQYWLS